MKQVDLRITVMLMPPPRNTYRDIIGHVVPQIYIE